MAMALLGRGTGPQPPAVDQSHQSQPHPHRVRHLQDRTLFPGGRCVFGASHAGRGGWTCTRAAAWLHRVAVENVLGIRRRGSRLVVEPCIPRTWREFQVSFRYGSSRYDINVHNPREINQGVAEIRVDGQVVGEIELADDGQVHRVEVIMGKSSPCGCFTYSLRRRRPLLPGERRACPGIFQTLLVPEEDVEAGGGFGGGRLCLAGVTMMAWLQSWLPA